MVEVEIKNVLNDEYHSKGPDQWPLLEEE
ncbi:uncharacterized protein G2W53_041539 [Senna tora]|uniref:Uncharacterized protein n=1 Tax=Senna tora TaxID=362788 RepID=A0A834VY18_9FABA|nr:uncharacterized protein G2W53_041539 [Senna tora]